MRTLLPAFITSSGRLPDNNPKLTTSLSKLNFILARTEGINGNSYVFYPKISNRNGWNTKALIFENLKPVEITKKLFQHHMNI